MLTIKDLTAISDMVESLPPDTAKFLKEMAHVFAQTQHSAAKFEAAEKWAASQMESMKQENSWVPYEEWINQE
jgi:hypothetical protein